MILEALAALFDGLGSTRRRREDFELRVRAAEPGSAAAREDFSHCWALENAAVKHGARDVRFAWRRGPDGKPGAAVELGTMPLWRTIQLDGIAWPSQRPPVSAEVSWTEAGGGRRRMTLYLD